MSEVERSETEDHERSLQMCESTSHQEDTIIDRHIK